MRKNTDYEIHVAYCCSDLFSEVCAVSIISLFENNKDIDSITVYILEDEISEVNRERLLSLARDRNRRIVFIPMPKPDVFYNDPRFTFDSVGRTYGRMIWGDVLPAEIHKVLSLDCDTMVLGSIKGLWDYDLGGCPIAGVDDCMGRVALVKTQHLNPDSVQCNAGMYIIDLDTWRKEGWTEIFCDHIKSLFDKGVKLGGYEEEVITHSLCDRFCVLPPQYNTMTLEQVMTYKELIGFRQPISYYSEEEIRNAVEHPVITHTTNFFYIQKRVFEENSDHPQRENYVRYRNMTPWKDDPPMNASYSVRHRIIKKFWHCMPRGLSFALAGFVRNEIRPLLNKKRDDI